MQPQAGPPRSRDARRRRWAAFLAAALPAALLVAPGAAPAAAGGCRTTIRVLPGATGDGAGARSPSGTVIGHVLVNGAPRPAAWVRTGALQLLPVPVTKGTSMDINPRGEIVGVGDRFSVAWHFAGGTVSFLPAAGHDFVYARRINASGQIAGALDDRAVRWPSYRQQAVPLPPAPGDQASFAKGINDAGWVGGDSDVEVNGTAHAALWDPAGRVHLLPGISGPRGFGEVYEVNNRLQAAGDSTTKADVTVPGTEIHAVRWDRDGTVQDLGTFPGDTESEALGLSANGYVAGRSILTDYVAGTEVGNPHAFVWPGHGPLLALPLPDGRTTADTASMAHQIDSNGTVIGGFRDHDGTFRPIVWTCAFTQAFAPGSTR